MMAGVEQNPGPRPRPVVPPRFITEIEDQNSMLGDTWNLNVPIEGDSPFNVKVLKDTIELPAIGHVEYSCDNDMVRISIEDVEVTDEGSYQIEVSNGSGVTASCTFNITVREEVQTVKCPPFAESITEGDIRWEKAVGESVSMEEVIAKVKTDKTSIQIPSPCSGVIESCLVNDGDTVEAGAQICTINVEVPLRFKKVRENQNYKIQLGETWKNYLQIVGDGPFNVKVTKDTIELPATGHMEYSCDNNVVRISIEDVEVTDEGSYQIEVSNGSRLNAFCTFKITVLRYNFRYQYLLVETGTMVLRKLFDSKVGNDLASYLSDTSSLQWKALQSLLKGKNGVRKLYDDQAALLPPRNSKPTSEKFDISLLNRLLKHICNPKDPNDPEQNREPTPEEKLEEDYIASLTDCRDNLSHSGTVRFPATELADKWNELTNILLQLNKFCGENKIPDLNDKIDRVKDMVIDEATENTLKEKIKYWHEKIDLKKDIARVEDKVHRVDDKLDTLLQETRANKMTIQTMNVTNQETLNVSSGSKNRPDDIMDIKEELMNIYMEDCSTLPVSPLCYEDDDEIDLLTVYQPPTMTRVPYHKQDNPDDGTYSVTSYQQLFHKGDRQFRNIYITGDAGVGKTSLCQCMALLWCKSKKDEKVSNKFMQKDIESLAKFEYVFYVSLRETEYIDILDMIIDQLFYTKDNDTKDWLYKNLEYILKEKECLVILDALDEWSPRIENNAKEQELPRKLRSDKCVYLTTCRPYKIEEDRLSKKNLDQQVKMTGIHDQSLERYVSKVVGQINKANDKNRDSHDFLTEVRNNGLYELLSIPMIASQLVVMWFDKPLTEMTRALIYGNIIEMLFKRAEKRNIKFPSQTTPEVSPPEALSDLTLISTHFSLLKEVCFLSFMALFKQDHTISSGVFTEECLMKSPYSFTRDVLDFLYRSGILSKNKVIAGHAKKVNKLSFLHKSYLECFAALYVLSFDTTHKFDTIVNQWRMIHAVVEFENFFLLLAGFSSECAERAKRVQILFETIFRNTSEDLRSKRQTSLWTFLSLKRLQDIVKGCFKEINQSPSSNIALKLEDFTFHNFKRPPHLLLKLLVLNQKCIKSLDSNQYFGEFDYLKTLERLEASSDFVVDTHFTNFMLHNKNTLRSVTINNDLPFVFPEGWLPLRNLIHLTCLRLRAVQMSHDALQDIMTFLCSNSSLEHIELFNVRCGDHKGENCRLGHLDLSKNERLCSLELFNVDTICDAVNPSSLLSLLLFPFSKSILDSYANILHSVEGSKLEHLQIGDFLLNSYSSTIKLDSSIMKTIVSTVKTLPSIKTLTLGKVWLSDDVLLELHPHVSEVDIMLEFVHISPENFKSFVDNFLKTNLNPLVKCKMEFDKEITCNTESDLDSMKKYLESLDNNLKQIEIIKSRVVHLGHKFYLKPNGWS